MALWAQASAQAATLGELSGQTDLQSRVGNAVAATCGPLAAAGTSRAGPSAVEDLFARCQDLVHTGNVLAGTGATSFSLGLSQSQLNDALLQVAHEESTAQGTSSTESSSNQTGNVANRLASLRAGGPALGVNIAGLTALQRSLDLPGAAFAGLGRPGAGGAASGQDVDQSSRLGAFLNGTVSFGDKDPTSEEAGFNFLTGGLTGGLDYRFGDTLIGGVALGYTTTDNDFDGGAGKLGIDAITISIYGSYYPLAELYVDLIASFSLKDQELTRNIVYPSVNRTARGDTDAQEYAVSVGGGYDFVYQGWTFGPYGRLDYVNTEIDGFTESGALGLNLTFGAQDITSLSTVLGAQVTRAISTDFGVLIPAAHADWQHEFEDESRLITVQYAADPNANRFSVITDSPDRDFANLGASLALVLPGGWMAFVAYETVLGLRDISNHIFTFGGRLEF
jgi:outer membrane autotransporter protein